ncbi:hypothetical protein DQ384_23115 [Sphaerisporangium album]|uniref:Uncharacterized protein n=1 Tax=Sphaerisporangium album TaxID=509200 RepID=A0A367FG47_9ACTN|nr:hypothetical protein [Sphaerisporangium album]RCG28635.1 hypothetical protein DQ384_23115 [Sphaerisporangium album]
MTTHLLTCGDPRDVVASALGTLAGSVADPKEAAARLRSRVSPARPLALAALLAAGYLAGRSHARRARDAARSGDRPARARIGGDR